MVEQPLSSLNARLTVGSAIEFQSFGVITAEQLRQYADASGDFNPIHLDEAVAKKVGLPGIIAHGMFVSALIAERARTFIREHDELQDYSLCRYQSKFKAMTLLGDSVSIGGSVRESTEAEVVLDLQAKNQRGETTTQGVVRLKKLG